MASVNGSKTNQEGEITPQERARVEKSVRGLEQAPSSRQQLGVFTNWRQVQDQLGQPFNNERVPLKKLKLMRRDPMFAFGMHYQKMPLVKAPWFMECRDPQVAGFMDSTIRAIVASLIITQTQKLEMGFQAIAKRFQYKAPEGTYVDENGEEKPVWDTTGGIQPITLKQFVALPPEGVEPMFDDSTGEFNGIKYTPPSGSTAPMGKKSKGSGGSSGAVEIDLYHALWVTNEIESVYGNMFGYPRLAYGYPYWWSYWFRWAIADRAFEKKGDPSIIVRHPEGEIDMGEGEMMPNAQYALMMAERLRSGAAIALPSQPYTNFEDRPSQMREWDIEFLKGGVELDPFDKSFDYLDIMKLRSVFVPEQALIEGGGGTSSRNVAEEMFEGLVKGQTLLMEEIVESINRWIIPHLMLVNFPQQFDEGMSCRMKVQGFSSSDTELLAQLVQLIGQNHPEQLGLDVREALRQLNMPLLPQKQFDENLKAAADAAAAQGPKAVAPTTSASGVVPTKGRAPSKGENTPGPASTGAGGSFTGFAYVPPVGLAIELSAVSDAAANFMSDLPSSIHYEDKALRALTKQMWNAMQRFYASQYREFAEHVGELEAIQLSDEDKAEDVEMALPEVAHTIGKKIVDGWRSNLENLDETTARVSQLLEKMLDRSATIARKNAMLDKKPAEDEMQAWVGARVTDLVSNSVRSIREELTDFVARQFGDAEGDISPEKLSKMVESHYGEFPEWLASRFARTEARDIFNAGTLLTGQANGLDFAQAVDATGNDTDAHCERRDGQFFTIDQALREEEHPNGTLGWRLIKEPIALARVDEVPNAPEGALGSFDSDSGTIFLAKGIDHALETEFLLEVGEKLS